MSIASEALYTSCVHEKSMPQNTAFYCGEITVVKFSIIGIVHKEITLLGHITVKWSNQRSSSIFPQTKATAPCVQTQQAHPGIPMDLPVQWCSSQGMATRSFSFSSSWTQAVISASEIKWLDENQVLALREANQPGACVSPVRAPGDTKTIQGKASKYSAF